MFHDRKAKDWGEEDAEPTDAELEEAEKQKGGRCFCCKSQDRHSTMGIRY